MILATIAALALQAAPQDRTWGLTDPVVSGYDAISDVVPQQRAADGWTYRGRSMTGATMYTRPGASVGHLWVRFEYPTPNANGHLSDRQLNEFDCMGRYRTLQSAGFTQRDLLGEGRDYRGPPIWTYIAPDTMAFEQERHVCEAGEPEPR